jgi:N-acetyl-gamma-glutamyl-phosphate reductase common form
MPNVGLVGGRGYVGQEVIRCLAEHPCLRLTCVASSSLAGQPLAAEFPQWASLDLTFQSSEPEALVKQAVDVWILALGNGEAQPYVDALGACGAKLIDVSADFRCDPNWQYGLTECFPREIAAAARVANPGCYASGIQLALWPVRPWLMEPAIAFGVSGYSGAGRKPSPRNDPQRLADNLMPYHLIDHMHEKEVQRHLGKRVRLLPHVAEFFRGISLTISFQLSRTFSVAELHSQYRQFFDGQPLLAYDEAIPEIAQVRDTPLCRVGGLVRDPRDASRWVVVSALDNLSKGAATQTIQNVNLMCGYDHHLGIASD